jgi:hypothetical protein
MNNDKTLCGIGPRVAPLSPVETLDEGRALHGEALRAIARLNAYAQRKGDTRLEARATRALDALLTVQS